MEKTLTPELLGRSANTDWRQKRSEETLTGVPKLNLRTNHGRKILKSGWIRVDLNHQSPELRSRRISQALMEKTTPHPPQFKAKNTVNITAQRRKKKQRGGEEKSTRQERLSPSFPGQNQLTAAVRVWRWWGETLERVFSLSLVIFKFKILNIDTLYLKYHYSKL